jgi:hypothetical protein
MIVDHDVCSNDVLGSAKDHLLPGDKGKVFLKPFVFLGEAIWILRRRADYINVINLLKMVENILTVLNHGRIPEEAPGQDVLFGTLKCFHLGKSSELLSRLSSARVLLIKGRVLLKNIGQDSVHIDCNCFHVSVNLRCQDAVPVVCGVVNKVDAGEWRRDLVYVHLPISSNDRSVCMRYS